jgi:dTMP kinase
MAKYIVLEGIQGGGKTAQIQILADRLTKAGYATHTTREPGGSALASRVLRYITQNPQYPLTTKAEVLIYNASRTQSLETIRDLLERDVWVIADRNYLTTLAIQYYARNDGLDYDEIDAICRFAVGDMEPDATIVLDLDARTAAERTKTRAIKERFDGLSTGFLERMRQGYLTEAKKHNYPVVDARKNIEAVAEDIWNIVMDKQTSKPSKKAKRA